MWLPEANPGVRRGNRRGFHGQRPAPSALDPAGSMAQAGKAAVFSVFNRKQKTENRKQDNPPATYPVNAALGLIRAYQLLVSPLIPTCCRFAPTCSHYAAEALRRHGLRRGLRLGLRRLLRCHPFHPGGWDPVP